MTDTRLTAQDYPIAERQPDRVTGSRGKSLHALTLEAAVNGELQMEDLRITPEALLKQAQIARSVGRNSLAQNFERAAEMTRLTQEEVMRIYELLRPGRAGSKEVLLAAAERLRVEFGANMIAIFLEEAAAMYERRGLFGTRY